MLFLTHRVIKTSLSAVLSIVLLLLCACGDKTPAPIAFDTAVSASISADTTVTTDGLLTINMYDYAGVPFEITQQIRGTRTRTGDTATAEYRVVTGKVGKPMQDFINLVDRYSDLPAFDLVYNHLMTTEHIYAHLSMAEQLSIRADILTIGETPDYTIMYDGKMVELQRDVSLDTARQAYTEFAADTAQRYSLTQFVSDPVLCVLSGFDGVGGSVVEQQGKEYRTKFDFQYTDTNIFAVLTDTLRAVLGSVSTDQTTFLSSILDSDTLSENVTAPTLSLWGYTDMDGNIDSYTLTATISLTLTDSMLSTLAQGLGLNSQTVSMAVGAMHGYLGNAAGTDEYLDMTVTLKLCDTYN